MRRGAFGVSMVVTAALLLAGASLRVAASQAAPVQTQPDPNAAERTTQEQLCSACHEANLVAGAFRMPTEWDDTLSRMQSYGSEGSPAQLDLVRSFLLRNYGKANVNMAAAKDLAPVLDVTPALAEVIVAYRRDKGPFMTLEDLKQVPGLESEKVDARKARLLF